MTTFPFIPNGLATPPFSSNMTLDGVSYLFTAFWGLAGQRWYFTLTDQNGNTVLHRPLTGSPIGSDINLVFGLFQASTLIYRTSTGNIDVNP